MKRRSLSRTVISLCLILFFTLAVLLPILTMLTRITPAGFRETVSSPQFLPAVKNSILTGLTATAISLLLALAAAFCLERTSLPGKAFFGTLFVLPMLIPSISHAFGLVSLFGANGFLTRLLHLKGSIYGFPGIVLGSVLYSFPVALLMFTGILQYEDGMTYKAAEVLGIPRFRQFTGITLPYLKKTLISAFFAVFTMIVTDYGVPLMIGGKTVTLSVLMYQKAAAMIDYDTGSVLGALLLIPAVVAFLADLSSPEHGQSGFVTEPVVPKKKGTGRIFSFLFCVLVGIFVLAPVFAFCLMVFETKYPIDPTPTLAHIKTSFHRGAGSYLGNSLLYSLIAGLFGTALAFFSSYLTARVKGLFGKAVHLISITSMAIPGLVLGLSYLIFFHGTPVYGTVILIALVNSVHFFSSPYLMMYNTLAKVNPDLESVGLSLGPGDPAEVEMDDVGSLLFGNPEFIQRGGKDAVEQPSEGMLRAEYVLMRKHDLIDALVFADEFKVRPQVRRGDEDEILPVF